jgi:hypothetical protein
MIPRRHSRVRAGVGHRELANNAIEGEAWSLGLERFALANNPPAIAPP